MKKQEWLNHHKCCPKCKDCGVIKTEKEQLTAEIGADYSDDINSATCPKCGWKGMVKQLVPDPKDVSNVKNINVTLRTIDKDNDTYVSIEDAVGVMRQFGSELLPKLKDPQAQTFTENIIGEFIKMFISAEITHRADKIKTMKEMEDNANLETSSGE